MALCNFSEKILNECRAHAQANSDIESCGLILKYRPLVFFPMKNVLHSDSRFEMHKETFLIKNKIHTIFHSHPYSIAYPSEEDFRKSRSLNIPYLIYSCMHDNFIYFNLKKCIPIKV